MAFASTANIASRFGRELSASEEAAATFLLAGATSAIAEAVDKDDDWADALDPVPGFINLMCVELTCRAMANPQMLVSMQESLGAHNYSVRFSEYGIFPTDAEARRLRRAVYGTNAGSARANNIANHVGFDEFDDIYVDEDVIAS